MRTVNSLGQKMGQTLKVGKNIRSYFCEKWLGGRLSRPRFQVKSARCRKQQCLLPPTTVGVAVTTGRPTIHPTGGVILPAFRSTLGRAVVTFRLARRSSVCQADYAVNRHYDPQQGRFTQVDPIGMRSVGLSSPQTLNLYAYCTNDPINHTDPSVL